MRVEVCTGIVGLVLVAVGVHLGLLGHIVDVGSYSGIRCGSASRPVADPSQPPAFVSVCPAARPSATALWVMVIAGAVTLLGAPFIRTDRRAAA